jgi:alanine racemase
MSLVDKKTTNEAVWAEVSLAALAANYRRLRTASGDAELLAVVKADAYGHGAVACAPALVQAGAQWLGVTSAAEGIAVRAALSKNGPKPARILVMRGLLAEECDAALNAGLTPGVWTLEQMDALEAAAVRLGAEEIAVHLEIDTGMSRQGVAPAELAKMLARFTTSSPLKLEGVMTHFAASEDVVSPQNAAQMKVLAQAVEQVRAAGLQPEWIHAGSTSTVDAGVALAALREIASGAKLMCRTGIGLYGYALPLTGAASRVRGELEPVLAWKTQVLSVQDVAAGARVGYSESFVAERPMRLALLPVGYADGLRRELSNAGDVLIAGKRARIVGRVSMDVTIVDVTGIAGVKAGDEVVIFGTQGGERITADDHARIAGTISYEILCGIASRVSRSYS